MATSRLLPCARCAPDPVAALTAAWDSARHPASRRPGTGTLRRRRYVNGAGPGWWSQTQRRTARTPPRVGDSMPGMFSEDGQCLLPLGTRGRFRHHDHPGGFRDYRHAWTRSSGPQCAARGRPASTPPRDTATSAVPGSAPGTASMSRTRPSCSRRPNGCDSSHFTEPMKWTRPATGSRSRDPALQESQPEPEIRIGDAVALVLAVRLDRERQVSGQDPLGQQRVRQRRQRARGQRARTACLGGNGGEGPPT